MKGALSFAAFSKAGVALAKKIAAREGGEIWAPPRHCGAGVHALGDLEQWTGRMFAERGAIIFISACGIAVRAVAPHLKGKERDPAVVALDEIGAYVIPLLSGHLGGANALARRIAGITGGKAVITTATDINGVPAIDEWARERCCAIENLSAAKIISVSALEGAEVGIAVTEELHDAPWPVTLWLRPANLVLGVGCKRGVPHERIKAAFDRFIGESEVSPLSISAIASVDIKRDEPGLIELAAELGVPFVTFSAEQLKEARGDFIASERVVAATGVDNVCERAAVLESGGFLMRRKTKYEGITLALAKRRRDGLWK